MKKRDVLAEIVAEFAGCTLAEAQDKLREVENARPAAAKGFDAEVSEVEAKRLMKDLRAEGAKVLDWLVGQGHKGQGQALAK